MLVTILLVSSICTSSVGSPSYNNSDECTYPNTTRVRRALSPDFVKDLTGMTRGDNSKKESVDMQDRRQHRYHVKKHEDLSVDREYQLLLKHRNGNMERFTYLLDVVGLFMRIHKFADVDWRGGMSMGNYKNKMRNRNKDHTRLQDMLFPQPPLGRLDPDVRQHCEKGLYHCLKFLEVKARKSDLTMKWRRKFKTQKSFMKFVEDMDIVAHRGMYTPFNNFYEQFTLRTTASYYLCWFTIQQLENLRHFHSPCSLPGLIYGDTRDNDNLPFACAQFSFCPDYCKDNPCAQVGDGTCRLDSLFNKDFDALAWNDFNYTCDCESKGVGLRWSSPAKGCIDIDECREGLHTCPSNEDCRNTLGSFECFCKPGQYRRSKDKKCAPDIEKDIQDPLYADREMLMLSRNEIDEHMFAKDGTSQCSGGMMPAIAAFVISYWLYS